MFALFQFGTIAKQASCQLDCSFYITVYCVFFQQLQNIGFQLIVSIHPANPIHVSCQDGYLFITMYSFYQMHPARMVVHASYQDGCLCHTALSRSVTGRLGVTRGLRPFITLFVHFPFLLVSPYIFVINFLSPGEAVYIAICPFFLFASLVFHLVNLFITLFVHLPFLV